MKRFRFLYTWLLLLVMGLLVGCNTVHEFPYEEPEIPDVNVEMEVSVSLHDITMVDDTTDDAIYPQVIGKDYELRLIAEFYTASTSQLYTRVVQPLHTQDDTAKQIIRVQLPPTSYYVLLWREYVKTSDPQVPLYYQSESGLRSITMLNANVGDQDEMDCCFGKTSFDLTPYAGKTDVHISLPVYLKRPVARYILITNDIAKQAEKLMRKMSDAPDRAAAYAQVRAQMEDYSCRVLYQGNGLYGFDCYSGKPNDAKAGMYFDAEVELLSDMEARIAFCYPFAFVEGNTIHASLQIFDENDNLIQEVPDVEIPVVQGKLTVIKSDFLTHEYPQGIIIDQQYDGQFDILLPD